MLGIVTGLAIVWVCAAVVLEAPGQRLVSFRHDVQRSWIVRKLDAALPPSQLYAVLKAIDPFPSITGPSAPTLPPSVGVLRNHAIRSSVTRVVKVLGTACGAGVEGSGWFARRDLVVTAAHVVAGERSTVVEIPGDRKHLRRDRRRLRSPQRHRCPPHLGRHRAAAAHGRSAGRSLGRDRRLPARREPHGDSRPHRADGERVHRGRARQRPGRACDHGRRRKACTRATPAARSSTPAAASRRRSSRRRGARRAATPCRPPSSAATSRGPAGTPCRPSPASATSRPAAARRR